MNIGNPTEFTILECARKVIATTGSKSQIKFEALPQDDPKQRRPDISKAKRLLGWEPKVELESGLKLSLEYFRRAVAEKRAKKQSSYLAAVESLSPTRSAGLFVQRRTGGENREQAQNFFALGGIAELKRTPMPKPGWVVSTWPRIAQFRVGGANQNLHARLPGEVEMAFRRSNRPR